MLKLVVFLLCLYFWLSLPVQQFLSARKSDGGCETSEECDSDIKQYTQKLSELEKTKDSLSKQLNILSSQISLTLLKINQTELLIRQLQAEIDKLTVKINILDDNLNQLSSIYLKQIDQNYRLSKRFANIPILVLMGGDSFLKQYKYVTTLQRYNQSTLLSMETTRTNYDIQKSQKQKKQEEMEILQGKLASEKNNLAKQKESKSTLLSITQNDENRYQQLKKAAENELSSLLKAKFVGKKEVRKGDPLGLMGNTGYSFGDHLHFGLYDLKEDNLAQWSYPNDADPIPYINQNRWPMDAPIEITQDRGRTKYSYLYSDHFHHGVDMVSDNKTVRAVNDGVAYIYRNAGSSLGNHVKLFHPDGKMTLYLHLQ